MADKFSATGTAAVGASGTAVTILGLVASTSIRGFIDEVSLGISSAGADLTIRWILQRFSAAGTAGSSVTPRPYDAAAPASLITSGQGAYSAEPTYSSQPVLWDCAANDRGSAFKIPFRNPIVIPATSGNGVGVLAASSSSGTPTARVVADFHQ